MNNATSWEQVMTLVHQDDCGKWDNEVDADKLRMGEGGDLVLGNSGPTRAARLSDFALSQLCAKLELPARYLKRIPSELRARCVNHDLAAAASNGRRFLIRGKGEMVRAVLSHMYSRVNNIEFLEIFEQLGRNIQHRVRSFSLNETGMWLKVTLDALQAKDPSNSSSELKLGLVIGNSETGCRAVTIEPFVFRKLCTNDAVVAREEALDVRHIHLKRRELKSRIAESMNFALKAGDEALEAFLRAYEEPVEDPAALIKRLAEKRCLSAVQTDHIQLAYQVEPLPTKFGVVNALTRAAQSLEADDRIELERLAGSLLDRSNAIQLAA